MMKRREKLKKKEKKRKEKKEKKKKNKNKREKVIVWFNSHLPKHSPQLQKFEANHPHKLLQTKEWEEPGEGEEGWEDRWVGGWCGG